MIGMASVGEIETTTMMMMTETGEHEETRIARTASETISEAAGEIEMIVAAMVLGGVLAQVVHEERKKKKRTQSMFQAFVRLFRLSLANTDYSGIPIVKTSSESQRTQDAIAKARKAVEEDQKEDAARDVEKTEQDGTEPKAGTANKVEKSIKADVEATDSKKREREDDSGEDNEAKKTKVDDAAS